jgi:antitoxin (DNA-binding transcriptional repressor) of toxin-antitoxin stability system
MFPQKINVHEAKTKLSAVLAQIEKNGESVVICRNGKPIVEFGPLKKRSGSRLGKHPVMSKIKINYYWSAGQRVNSSTTF